MKKRLLTLFALSSFSRLCALEFFACESDGKTWPPRIILIDKELRQDPALLQQFLEKDRSIREFERALQSAADNLASKLLEDPERAHWYNNAPDKEAEAFNQRCLDHVKLLSQLKENKNGK